MIEHKIKCWSAHFQNMKRGLKPFEIRRNDRNYQAGDILRICEFDLFSESYTGREILKKITIVTEMAEALKKGFVVLGLKNLTLKDRFSEIKTYTQEAKIER